MDNEVVVQEESKNWKPTVLLIGGGLGLVAGLLTAFLLIKSADNNDKKPSFNTGELFRIAMLVLVTISRITKLGND